MSSAAPDNRRRSVVRRWLVGEPKPHENRYRDLVLMVALGLIVWAIVVAQSATHQATRALAHVQEGRATSITITCAVVSAISQAGQTAIQGPRSDPEHRTRTQVAHAYAREIDRRVSRELGQLGRPVPRGLIRPNGTLNCRVLQRVSAVPGPQ